MSKQEQLKLELVVKVQTGIMSRQNAIHILQCSERTFTRYLKAYREKDILFIKHGNSGHSPPNKTDSAIKEMVIFLTKNKYFDFNILHLKEKLKEHGLEIKRETLRKWCHEIGMVKRSKRRRSKARFKRERMNQRGILLQMDGSYHEWFGKEKSCLIAAVDDATSEILEARFYKSESTIDCLDFLQRLIEKHGTFKNLYVDKAGVYGGIKRSGFSQVERALGELGTYVIYAHSPQGKGRIERLFNTLQDRMIPEMRINKIIFKKQANDFLKEYIISHNQKFSVLPHDSVSVFCETQKNLTEVFCIKETRQVANDHTISFKGETYLISEKFKYSIKNQSIEIRIKANEEWQAYFGDFPLKLIKIEKIKRNVA